LENNSLSEADKADFLAMFQGNEHEEDNKSLPPAELTQWHHDYQLKVNYDVYESEAWVKFALSNSTSDGMKDDEAKLYRLALIKILSNDDLQLSLFPYITLNSYCQLHTVELNDIGVVYIKAQFPDNSKPVYLLLHWGQSSHSGRALVRGEG
jgi:hypothetical protein